MTNSNYILKNSLTPVNSIIPTEGLDILNPTSYFPTCITHTKSNTSPTDRRYPVVNSIDIYWNKFSINNKSIETTSDLIELIQNIATELSAIPIK